MRGGGGLTRTSGTDRGTSFPLSHVVTLGITTAVITALVVSAGGFLADERARATRGELSTVGAHLVSDLTAADRLVDGAANETLTLSVTLPRRVSGGAYLVVIETRGACASGGPSTACLELAAPGAGVAVALPFRNETAVANGSAPGGRLAIEYRNGTLTIADRP